MLLFNYLNLIPLDLLREAKRNESYEKYNLQILILLKTRYIFCCCFFLSDK